MSRHSRLRARASPTPLRLTETIHDNSLRRAHHPTMAPASYWTASAEGSEGSRGGYTGQI
jgi:hypothetical protein